MGGTTCEISREVPGEMRCNIEAIEVTVALPAFAGLTFWAVACLVKQGLIPDVGWAYRGSFLYVLCY